MKCSLSHLTEEHSKKDEPRYNIFVNCPLLDGRQICLWCCLHICDIGEPLKRGDSALAHPSYEKCLPEITGRDWDDMWQTCSKCSKG